MLWSEARRSAHACKVDQKKMRDLIVGIEDCLLQYLSFPYSVNPKRKRGTSGNRLAGATGDDAEGCVSSMRES
jgi:hypothetical protein